MERPHLELCVLFAHCLVLGLFIFVPGLLSLVLGCPTSVRVPAQETGLKSNQLLVGYSQTLHHHCPSISGRREYERVFCIFIWS